MIKKVKCRRWYWPVAAGSVIVIIYYFVFSSFFPQVLFSPGDKGFLGYDYALGLSMLLDGYFWFRINGLKAVFWFTPAVCGGVPAFADPIHFYYSLPQFLTFLVNPYLAVALTFFIFAVIGFWGFYCLLRQVFKVAMWGSLLGATLFVFNGFYVYRMIIGHFIVHAFMLVPWCAWFLLRQPIGPTRTARFIEVLFFVSVAGGFMAYMLYSGLQAILPPVFLGIVGVCCLYGTVFPQKIDAISLFGRLTGAVLVFLSLSAAKVSAVAHFMSNVSRTQYALPQFPEIFDLLKVLLASLFGRSPWEYAQETIVNMQLVLSRHEFEYAVTIVPLLIIGAGSFIYLKNIGESLKAWKNNWPPQRMICAGVLMMIVFLPIILNIYTPSWNQFLKAVPVIKSSSQNVRWFCLYIPIILTFSGICLQQVTPLRNLQPLLVVAGITFVVFWHISADNRFYRDQSYSPAPVISSYRAVKQGNWQPGINAVSTQPPPAWWQGYPIARTGSLIYGHSQMRGWVSMFGYQLENFPVCGLRPGSVWQERAGNLNIKNPACYVFPEENQCEPGDHFSVQQKDQAFAFSHYRPFSFQMSLIQKIANTLTVGTLICLLFGGAIYITYRLCSNVKLCPKNR